MKIYTCKSKSAKENIYAKENPIPMDTQELGVNF